MQNRRSILAGACVALLAVTASTITPRARASQDPAAAPEQALTVVCVRHAEKAPDGRDPALTPAGTERAAALARLLGHAGVTHVFASEFRRTRATVAPLAAAAGLTVTVVPAGDPAAQVAALEALPAGAVAVVAGHSNTVPGLVAALGGAIEGLAEHERYGPMLADDEYDRLFVVTRHGRADAAPRVATLELRYGE